MHHTAEFVKGKGPHSAAHNTQLASTHTHTNTHIHIHTHTHTPIYTHIHTYTHTTPHPPYTPGLHGCRPVFWPRITSSTTSPSWGTRECSPSTPSIAAVSAPTTPTPTSTPSSFLLLLRTSAASLRRPVGNGCKYTTWRCVCVRVRVYGVLRVLSVSYMDKLILLTCMIPSSAGRQEKQTGVHTQTLPAPKLNHIKKCTHTHGTHTCTHTAHTHTHTHSYASTHTYIHTRAHTHTLRSYLFPPDETGNERMSKSRAKGRAREGFQRGMVRGCTCTCMRVMCVCGVGMKTR